MPLKINPKIISIQSETEAEQLEGVEFAKEQLEFAIKNLSHADEVAWASELDDYRDCTQYPNVEISDGSASERYWASYCPAFEEIANHSVTL